MFWIAESQMMKETEDVVLMHLDFLPLKSNVNIHIGNALQMDWASIISPLQIIVYHGKPTVCWAICPNKRSSSRYERYLGTG
ncbi:MAG: DNA methyltransferase [Faecalibacterium sp.]